MAIRVATNMHNVAKSLMQWLRTWLFYYLCKFSVFKWINLCIPFYLESHSIHHYGENYFRLIWHNRLYLYTAAALLLGLFFSLKMAVKRVIHPCLWFSHLSCRCCCVCVISDLLRIGRWDTSSVIIKKEKRTWPSLYPIHVMAYIKNHW